MNKYLLLLALTAFLPLSSCSDSESPTIDTPQSQPNSVTVNGQSAKSVLTLGFLMANHTELPAGSRATDYGYEYDDDDGVFMTEEEAAAFLAPYTQMGRDLRDALIQSYFPETSRSGDGGITPGGDGNSPLDDPLIGTLPIEDQEAVNMLYQMTDEEVTQVAIILSTMAFDDQILEINGCQITLKHTFDCLKSAVGIDDLMKIFSSITKSASQTTAGRKLLLKIARKELIRAFGRFAGRFIPGYGYLELAQNIYDFTVCMLNTPMQVLTTEEYDTLLGQYDWLTNFDTIELEISFE